MEQLPSKNGGPASGVVTRKNAFANLNFASLCYVAVATHGFIISSRASFFGEFVLWPGLVLLAVAVFTYVGFDRDEPDVTQLRQNPTTDAQRSKISAYFHRNVLGVFYVGATIIVMCAAQYAGSYSRLEPALLALAATTGREFTLLLMKRGA